VTGLFGGAFDPPHKGHVALAEEALRHFELERLLVLVVVRPGHKDVGTPVDGRLGLARAAFAGLPDTEILREEHAYTVDAVRGGRFGDALFLIGADEFGDFLTWKEPQEVLEHVRLGVATRRGYGRERLEKVLAQLERRDRVEFFAIPEVPVSSSEIRARIAHGQSVEDAVPPTVARLISDLALYR
jgi:nicotinate-nucleotide adenylyltransferase